MDTLSPVPIVDAELLSAFAAFAEALNFTVAAKAMRLSQPCLFERVQRLSSLFGVSLYVREGRALTLTPQGTHVAAYARETLARARAFTRSLHGAAARESVALAAGEGAFLYLLGPAIERFVRTEAQSAELRLHTLGGPRACESVLSGESQLAVAVVDMVPRALAAKDVLRTGLHAVVPKGHRLAKKRSVKLSELAQERLVLPPPGRSHRDFVGRAIESLGHSVESTVEADGWALMIEFAARGLGVAVVNGLCALPRSVISRPIPELGTVCYRLLQRRDATPSAPTQRLADAIVALGQKKAVLLER